MGWIGEDKEGVWCARHPEAALLEMPELWPIVDRWNAGVRSLDGQSYDALSAYEYAGSLVMAAAHNRAELAEMRERYGG